MNCNREKYLSLSSEYKNFSFLIQILSPLKCSKRSESKMDSHSWIQGLAFHELLPPLGESFLTGISYQDTWHFFTARVSHNTGTSILKINGCWTLNKTCLSYLNLQFMGVHLFLLRLRLPSNNSSLMQSNSKTVDQSFTLGSICSQMGKVNRGVGVGYQLMHLRFFQGPSVFR